MPSDQFSPVQSAIPETEMNMDSESGDSRTFAHEPVTSSTPPPPNSFPYSPLPSPRELSNLSLRSISQTHSSSPSVSMRGRASSQSLVYSVHSPASRANLDKSTRIFLNSSLVLDTAPSTLQSSDISTSGIHSPPTSYSSSSTPSSPLEQIENTLDAMDLPTPDSGTVSSIVKSFDIKRFKSDSPNISEQKFPDLSSPPSKSMLLKPILPLNKTEISKANDGNTISDPADVKPITMVQTDGATTKRVSPITHEQSKSPVHVTQIKSTGDTSKPEKKGPSFKNKSNSVENSNTDSSSPTETSKQSYKSSLSDPNLASLLTHEDTSTKPADSSPLGQATPTNVDPLVKSPAPSDNLPSSQCESDETKLSTSSSDTVPTTSEAVVANTSASDFSPSNANLSSDSGTSVPAPRERSSGIALPSLGGRSRKLPSPFSWLSRNTGFDKKLTPSSLTPSRDIEMSPDPSLAPGSGVDGCDRPDSQISTGRTSRSSLKNRFNVVRMREEANAATIDTSDVPSIAGNAEDTEPETDSAQSMKSACSNESSKNQGTHHKVKLSSGSQEPQKDGAHAGRTRLPSIAQSSGTGLPDVGLLVNPNLPPGTAAGMAASAPQHTVDWDLWQRIVYEGPVAVERSSPEELKEAIARGIPGPIRGVVWQVLADVEKEEELLDLYWDLVNQGTDKDRRKLDKSASNAQLNESNGNVSGDGEVKEKTETVSSSRASIKSTGSGVSSSHDKPNVNEGRGTISGRGGGFSGLSIGRIFRGEEVTDDMAAIQKLEKTIRRDLGQRTSFNKYVMASGLQDGLFGVCKAYSLYDPEVGYAQGMNFLAMPLLFNMAENEAFAVFVRIMMHYRMRDMFTGEMPRLHLQLYQFERALEDLEPALYCHLNRRGVTPKLYATQWFLTLFGYRFPLQLVLRIYDLVLGSDSEGEIIKFGIALMQKNREKLMKLTDMMALTTFLKERLFDSYIDKTPSASSLLDSGFFGNAGGVDREVYRAEELVRDACNVVITKQQLETYAEEWHEKDTERKEKEAELDGLRSQVSLQSTQIRQLEERVETSDREHVEAASQLVRLQVDHAKLLDTNEALQCKVEELQKVVDSHDVQMERNFKEELDAVLARNTDVYNENHQLQEQLREMERELVESKMKWAQVNTEYESLKQKWNSILNIVESS